MTNCPFCAEEILDAAVVCKHCGRDVTKPSGVTAEGPSTLETLYYQRAFEKFDKRNGFLAT